MVEARAPIARVVCGWRCRRDCDVGSLGPDTRDETESTAVAVSCKSARRQSLGFTEINSLGGHISNGRILRGRQEFKLRSAKIECKILCSIQCLEDDTTYTRSPDDTHGEQGGTVMGAENALRMTRVTFCSLVLWTLGCLRGGAEQACEISWHLVVRGLAKDIDRTKRWALGWGEDRHAFLLRGEGGSSIIRCRSVRIVSGDEQAHAGGA